MTSTEKDETMFSGKVRTAPRQSVVVLALVFVVYVNVTRVSVEHTVNVTIKVVEPLIGSYVEVSSFG